MDQDPFGLRSLDIETLRSKRGAKWGFVPARYAAWVADMDYPVAPAIRQALREVIDSDEFGYPNWGGPAVLSPAGKQFATRMSTRYGWSVGEDRVHDMNDVMQGVQATIMHSSRPGDGVVLHLPAYPPFLDTIQVMQRRLIGVQAESTDAGYRFDYDRLEAELAGAGARVWILCHPHNPLGHTFDRTELERVAEIAERFDLTVVSDEIHADLTLAPAWHLPFAALGPGVQARTVTVTSASKSFNLAGMRWAALHAGSDAIHAALAAMPGHYLGAANLMGVVATVAAWTDDDEWLAAVHGVLDENRHALAELLATHLPGAVYHPPAATYLAWVDVRGAGYDDDPAAVFRERGVELMSGLLFGAPGAGHVRINMATSPTILAELVAAMAG